MITCPKCNQSLPDWSQNCQFCGADCKTVARPVAAAKKQYKSFQVPMWVWYCYYGIAIWWVIRGGFEIMDSFYMFGKPEFLTKLDVEVGPNVVGIIVGALNIVFGLGLILKIEIIRGIVNFFSGLKLLFGVLGLAGTVMGMSMFGAMSLPFVFLSILDIATAAGMIYLIGETDMKGNL